MRIAHLPCHSLAAAGLVIVALGPLAAQAPNPATPTDDPAALVSQGQKLNTDGNPTAALVLYTRALKQDPHFVDAHVAAGVALDLEGQYPAARAHLEQAIAIAPNDTVKARALRTMAICTRLHATATTPQNTSGRSLMQRSQGRIGSGPRTSTTSWHASTSSREISTTPTRCIRRGTRRH